MNALKEFKRTPWKNVILDNSGENVVEDCLSMFAFLGLNFFHGVHVRIKGIYNDGIKRE